MQIYPPAAAHVASESMADGVKRAVLKDGSVIPPTFPVGDDSLHDATYMSVRVKWSNPPGIDYPVCAYRVSTAEVGKGFEVRGETPQCLPSKPSFFNSEMRGWMDT